MLCIEEVNPLPLTLNCQLTEADPALLGAPFLPTETQHRLSPLAIQSHCFPLQGITKRLLGDNEGVAVVVVEDVVLGKPGIARVKSLENPEQQAALA
ncbi:hypothetical protein D9M68_479810 [compost metagenome]